MSLATFPLLLFLNLSRVRIYDHQKSFTVLGENRFLNVVSIYEQYLSHCSLHYRGYNSCNKPLYSHVM